MSYSKSSSLKLNSQPKPCSNQLKTNPLLGTSNTLKEAAPENLQRLITRLDLANHLAKNGYGLNILELSELLETSPNELEEKNNESLFYRLYIRVLLTEIFIKK